MGIAAYQRGNIRIRQEIDAEARPVEFEIMDRLNAIPKHPDAPAPYQSVSISHGHGGWWIACLHTGFGYWYRDLNELMRRWRVVITEYDDAKGFTAIPSP